MIAMKYDLLIQHGEVLDPGAGLKGRLDVAISGGRIVEVAPSLPETDARRTISARGLYVTPGLIDIHAHVFVNAHDMGGHTDHYCRHSGVTTPCCMDRRCGRIEPYPCSGSCGADVLRAFQLQHSVQHVGGDRHLGCLSPVGLEA